MLAPASPAVRSISGPNSIRSSYYCLNKFIEL